MALNERLRYDELCQSFIGVLLDHDRSASRARIGARSIMRKKVHCRVFLYTGHMFFLLKGTKTELLSFFKNISFFFYYLEDKKNVFLAVVRLLSLCFSAAGQVMDECRHLSTSNEETP